MNDRVTTLLGGRRERLGQVVGRYLAPSRAPSAPPHVRRHLMEEATDLYWDELDYDRDRLAKPWTGGHLKRHPGLWSQSPIGSIACRLYNGLQSVSWLTFLGSDYTEKLGGKDALQAQLEGAAEVSPLGQGGCLIKAGDAPELGDVNRQDILPSYRAVWSALEPVRADEDALAELWVDGMEIDDMQVWFKRFEQ